MRRQDDVGGLFCLRCDFAPQGLIGKLKLDDARAHTRNYYGLHPEAQ